MIEEGGEDYRHVSGFEPGDPKYEYPIYSAEDDDDDD